MPSSPMNGMELLKVEDDNFILSKIPQDQISLDDRDEG